MSEKALEKWTKEAVEAMDKTTYTKAETEALCEIAVAAATLKFTAALARKDAVIRELEAELVELRAFMDARKPERV